MIVYVIARATTFFDGTDCPETDTVYGVYANYDKALERAKEISKDLGCTDDTYELEATKCGREVFARHYGQAYYGQKVIIFETEMEN